MNAYVTEYDPFMFKVDAHMRIGIAIRKPELPIAPFDRYGRFSQVKPSISLLCWLSLLA